MRERPCAAERQYEAATVCCLLQYETAADLLPSQTAMMGTLERRQRARSHPDPRLILTRSQRLPFHLAARCVCLAPRT